MQLDEFTKNLVENDKDLTNLYKQVLRQSFEAQILAGKKQIEAIKLAGKKEKKSKPLGIEQF